MPYKAGPNNSLRRYSSLTGRYIKESSEETLLRLSKTSKNSRDTKEFIRRENLRNRAFKSKDPLLKEVYTFLEQALPNKITHVNENIYFPNTKNTHECDIILKNSIVEIKSGKRGNFLYQYSKLKEYCAAHNKKAIIFAPNLPKRSLSQQKQNGIQIATNYHELKELITKWNKSELLLKQKSKTKQ